MNRFCLWGGRKGWVQVGSPADRRLQVHLRLEAILARGARNMVLLTIVLHDSLTPAIEKVDRAFKDLAKAVEDSRTW